MPQGGALSDGRLVHFPLAGSNCKSIEGLLTLQARYGDEIVVAARGDDATDAVAAIARLFADAFGTRDTGESGKPRLLITNVPNAHRRALARGCA